MNSNVTAIMTSHAPGRWLGGRGGCIDPDSAGRPARRRPAALDRPGTGGARAWRAPAGERDDTDGVAELLTKMPYSGELGSQAVRYRRGLVFQLARIPTSFSY